MNKKILSLLLFSTLLCSCGSNASLKFIDASKEENVRNYYEIFVRSFYDTDGDGLGDLNGVTAKLDYIKDLGYNGIWLMPINKAYSYHKYDVMNYYDIDPEFGTMEDFENLLIESEKRNIKIIMDLVVNHTSHLHPWFIESIEAKNNGYESEYLDYYNYSSIELPYYTKYGNIYYESQFVSSMPDLNLDSVGVRNEVKNIIEFYIDKGVDGFRLDTVINFYTGNTEKSVEFTKYIVDCAKAKDPYSYIVGEAWTNISEIEKYYSSGIDSLFAFGTGEKIALSINLGNDSIYSDWVDTIYDIAGDNIPAPFIGNHDTGRAAGILYRNEEKIKFGYGLLGMMNGNIFAYYGDEIGMVGSGVDPNKRIPLLWEDKDSDGYCLNPPGTTTSSYEFPSVKEQLSDENSILNYYKKVNYIRNNNPIILKGYPESVYSQDGVCIIEKTYNSEKILVVINFESYEQIVELKDNRKLIEKLNVNVSSNVTLNNNILKLSGYSIAIIK